MNRFEQSAYRFCADAAWDVVYFDGHGRVFRTCDIRVPVWQKAAPGARMICYCFGESEDRIRTEIRAHGRSQALQRVRAHIAAHRCACDIRNPRGTCCLGEISATVARIAEELHEDRTAR